jgi:HEAT repeat protein
MARRAVGLVLLAALGACKREEPPPPATTSATTTVTETAAATAAPPLAPIAVDESTRAKADILARSLQHGSLKPTELADPTFARSFLYLASAREEALVLVGALRAMATIYTAQAAPRRVLVDADYNRVVAARLGHPDPSVLAAALDAAKHSITGSVPDPAVLDQLVLIAGRHVTPIGRYAALDVLWMASGVAEDERKSAPFLLALDAEETWLVATALHRARGLSERLARRDDYREKAAALLEDADAGVRGRAAELLAALAQSDDERAAAAKLIVPLLSDSDGWVKAAACGALAALRYTPAIHALVGLTADDAATTYDLRGFQELDGRQGWVHHETPGWKVAGAALLAIDALSTAAVERYVFAARSESELAKAADQARAWYERVKGTLPAE